ncbi:hypothetical protein CC86DRAFT_400233 [Ophiobolus disseminans]|uniref:BTB domain-containing protein n=1 Tax=Ophiobolus disseminans TaxID=1469910 RepID=A0A6A7AK58_9PLEO|nr:hypothetical protein CC86DRAFT_400233 [Ophiobolus disseminans]
MAKAQLADTYISPEQLTVTITGPTVSVSVGADLKIYRVHKALLIHHAPGFKMRRPNQSPGIVLLPAIETGVFNLLVHYLYIQTIPNEEGDAFLILIERQMDAGGFAPIWDVLWACISAYQFAQEISATGFGAAVNNHLVGEWPDGSCELNSGAKQSLLAKAFEGGRQGQVMQQFLIDDYCESDWDDGEGDEGELSANVRLRCMRRLKELVVQPQANSELRCYLEHVAEGERDACPKLHMRFDDSIRHGVFE